MWLSASLLPINLTTMPHREQEKLSGCAVKLVKNTPVAHTELTLRSALETFVRPGAKLTIHCLDFCHDPTLRLRVELVEMLLKGPLGDDHWEAGLTRRLS